MKILHFILSLSFIFLVVINCKKNNAQEKNEIATKISLKNTFKNDFYIGTAINQSQFSGKDTLAVKILRNDFNTTTPENNLKWMHIHPQKNNFQFSEPDKYVKFGTSKNMFVVGHTLVWHSQLSDYVHKIKNSTELSNHLKTHITTIVNRYKGKINAWDVLNEALNEDGTLRESVFYNVLGASYIENAFIWAAEADPNAKLLYNDYNLCNPEKRKGVVTLVKNLQSKNIKIDGIGMQGHWNLTEPSLTEIEKSITTYAALGLKVSITELDITVLPNPWDLQGAEIDQNFENNPIMNPYTNGLPDSIQTKLANRYEAIFKIFKKHKDKIERITFWGVSDANSWLNEWPIKNRTNYPLLFNRNYQPKLAYTKVVALKNQ